MEPCDTFFPYMQTYLAHQPDDRPAHPPLTAPVVAVRAAPETAAPPAGSRYDRSSPPPSPVSGAATVAPSPSHGSAGAVTEAGVGWHGANRHCNSRDRWSAAGVCPPHLCR